MIRLAEETADDWWEVEALLDLCFAPGREALSSYRLRDECLVDGRLDVTRYQPLSRLGYRDYAVVQEVFQMPRPRAIPTR